jgi:phosphoribosylanthranilate isomerase
MTAIKICGITRREDAELAAELGAAFVGFVLWPNSPRAATLDVVRNIARSLENGVMPVGVFVDPSEDDVAAAVDAGIRMAQIHGEPPPWTNGKPPVRTIRAVHLAAAGDAIEPDIADETVLLDAHDPIARGGTGKTVDWARAAMVARSRHVILAGGLTPENVADAISQVKPFAVDVASGIESSPGIKDHARLRAFINAARGT